MTLDNGQTVSLSFKQLLTLIISLVASVVAVITWFEVRMDRQVEQIIPKILIETQRMIDKHSKEGAHPSAMSVDYYRTEVIPRLERIENKIDRK